MQYKPQIALFTSILSVSFAAIFIVFCSAAPLAISFYRVFFTTLFLVPIFFIYPKYANELKQIKKKQLIIMIGIGIILAVHFSLWITSLKLTSVASSVLLVTMHPIVVGPLAHFIFKERMSLLSLFGIIISIIGLILLIYGNDISGFGLDSLEGNLLALFGGIAAGIYILGGRNMRKEVSIIPYAFTVYGVAASVLLVLCLLINPLMLTISQQDLQLILLMALISGIFGHTLYNWSLAHIRATIASVALLGEPIGSAFFAYSIPMIHQIPSLYTLIGGGIILSGIFVTIQTMPKIQPSPIS